MELVSLHTMDRFNCKNSCSRLDALLNGLIQTVQQFCLSDLLKPENEQNLIYEQFLSILMKGVELIKKHEKTNHFNIFHKLRYGSQIRQVEKEISGFLQYQMPANMFLDVKNLVTELKSFHHLYDDENQINETISKLTNDPRENAVMLQQKSADDMFDEAPGNYDDEIVKSDFDFVVGLETNIWNLKRILLQREVSVVGMHGMGGIGKTTMVVGPLNRFRN